MGGVILSVVLRKERGDKEQIKNLAEKYHEERNRTQPGPKDNLGSIYKSESIRRLWSYVPFGISKFVGLI